MLAVVPDSTFPDSLALGTVYPFGNWTSNPQDIRIEEVLVTIDGAPTTVWVFLDGICTRTGTPDNSVEGYCHFTYSVYDPLTDAMIGTFATEGVLLNPCSTTPVIGGTGIFIATTGLVEICGAVEDETFIPPMVDSMPPNLDIFDGVDGYLHTIELLIDEEFLTATV